MKENSLGLELETKTDSNTTGMGNIACAGCIEFLKTIEDESVDLIATDPPYEINYSNFEWDKKNLDWEYISKEFSRVLKKNGNIIIFQGWSQVINTINIFNNIFLLKNWIIYDRIKGRGAKTNLVSTREDVLWYVKEDKNYTYNKIFSNIKKATGGTIGRKNGSEYRALSNVWTDISPIVPWSPERVAHPTQKPLMLMNRIVTIFSNENDWVLDPFMGSGSTMVSAKNLGRNYLGCEIDKEYFEIAKLRIQNGQ